MSRKSFIDSVEVKSPCSEDWEKMHGNDRVRFCKHCAKDVKNLSALTRKEAMRMVRVSNGGICIRYIKNPVSDRPLFADQLFQITRRAPGLAAGIMTASLSLSTLTYAQGGATPAAAPTSIVRIDEKKSGDPANSDGKNSTKSESAPSSSISGTTVDQLGAVIPNAQVTIFSVNANKTATTTTDGDGLYRFGKLEPGTYRIESEAPGFKTGVNQVVVSDAQETVADVSMGIELEVTVDVVLNVESVSLGGAMVSVEYSSPLNRAVANDDVDLVRELIAQGESVNGKDENYDGTTPLFIAVENGNAEIARLLLDFGARINPRDSEKQTPLMRLDDDATPELVELLLSYGAKVNLTDNDGNTVLILAAENVKPEVLRMLIDAGADVNLSNKEGQTALMNAADGDSLESVRLLLLAGAKVNVRNKEGDSAWDLTSDDEIEDLLVSFGAEVKEQTNEEPNEVPIDN